MAENASYILGCISKSVQPSGHKKWLFHCVWCLWGHLWSTGPTLGLPVKRKARHTDGRDHKKHETI